MSEEHSLVDIIAIARKRWLWVAGPILLLVTLAWLYTDRQTLRYEATARVVLSEDAPTRILDPGSQNPGIRQRDIENQIAIAYGNEVEALVTAELGVLPELAVSHNPESDVLLFLAEGSTAEGAARAANTWAEIFVTVRQERDTASIAAVIEGLEDRLATLQAEQDLVRGPLERLRRRIGFADDPADALQLQQEYELLAEDLRYELDLNSSEAQTTVADLAQLRLQSELIAAEQNSIAEPAEAPDDPANTPLSRILVIAVIAGVVTGVGLAVLADARDKSIRTASDLQKLTDLPLLAAVPRAKRAERRSIGLATVDNPKGPHADSFHQIRSALEFEVHLQPLQSVMVTSPSPGDGRSTVAANLALALGSVDTRTALVDSDYRAGSLHRIFGVERQPGLSNLVRREIEASRVARSVPDGKSEDLVVLPSGTVPPNPAAFVASPRFLSTLSWMETQAEMVVVDTPPLLGVPETHTLGRQVDGVILVIRAKRTTESQLQDALAVLEQLKARVVGIVLVNVRKPRKTLPQYLRARRRAARNLPPVLNVSEGARTADYQLDGATNTGDVNGDGRQDPAPVADLEAGRAPTDGMNGTVPSESRPEPSTDQVADESERPIHRYPPPEAAPDPSPNGVEMAPAVVHAPAELNGSAEEIEVDWAQDPTPIGANGQSQSNNGSPSSNGSVDEDDAEILTDTVELVGYVTDVTEVDAEEVTTAEPIEQSGHASDDPVDSDIDNGDDINNGDDVNNGDDSETGNDMNNDIETGNDIEIEHADIEDGLDPDIVSLAELDDGLVE